MISMRTPPYPDKKKYGRFRSVEQSRPFSSDFGRNGLVNVDRFYDNFLEKSMVKTTIKFYFIGRKRVDPSG